MWTTQFNDNSAVLITVRLELYAPLHAHKYDTWETWEWYGKCFTVNYYIVSETCRCSHPLPRLRFRTTLKTFPSTSPLTQWGGDVLRSDKYHSAQWKSKKRFNSSSQSFKTLIYGKWMAMNCIETESGKVFCLFYLLSFLRREARA